MSTLRTAVVLLIVALTTAAALPAALPASSGQDGPAPTKALATISSPTAALNPSTWNAELSSSDLGAWSRFQLHLDWSVPSAEPGDAVSFDLPAQLMPLTSEFTVTTPGGTTIAEARVRPAHHSTEASAPGSVLTFTYTAFVRGLEDITTSADLAVTWNRELLTPDSEIDLLIGTGPEQIELSASIATEGRDATTARVYGYWQQDSPSAAAGPLHWRFVTPVGPITDAHVQLRPGPGHQLDCDSIALRAQTQFAPNGDVIAAHELPLTFADITCSTRAVQVSLSPVTAGSAVMVLISSTETDADTGTNPDTEQSAFHLLADVELDGYAATLTSDIERVLSNGTGEGTPASTAGTSTTASGSSAPASSSGETAALSSSSDVLATWWVAIIPIVVALAAIPISRRRRHLD